MPIGYRKRGEKMGKHFAWSGFSNSRLFAGIEFSFLFGDFNAPFLTKMHLGKGDTWQRPRENCPRGTKKGLGGGGGGKFQSRGWKSRFTEEEEEEVHARCAISPNLVFSFPSSPSLWGNKNFSTTVYSPVISSYRRAYITAANLQTSRRHVKIQKKKKKKIEKVQFENISFSSFALISSGKNRRDAEHRQKNRGRENYGTAFQKSLSPPPHPSSFVTASENEGFWNSEASKGVTNRWA